MISLYTNVSRIGPKGALSLRIFSTEAFHIKEQYTRDDPLQKVDANSKSRKTQKQSFNALIVQSVIVPVVSCTGIATILNLLR